MALEQRGLPGPVSRGVTRRTEADPVRHSSSRSYAELGPAGPRRLGESPGWRAEFAAPLPRSAPLGPGLLGLRGASPRLLSPRATRTVLPRPSPCLSGVPAPAEPRGTKRPPGHLRCPPALSLSPGAAQGPHGPTRPLRPRTARRCHGTRCCWPQYPSVALPEGTAREQKVCELRAGKFPRSSAECKWDGEEERGERSPSRGCGAVRGAARTHLAEAYPVRGTAAVSRTGRTAGH